MVGIEEIIRWVMVIFSLGGALLVASSRKRDRMLGFFLWIVSNFYWMVDVFLRGDSSMGAMYVVYEIFNVIGFKNNWGSDN